MRNNRSLNGRRKQLLWGCVFGITTVFLTALVGVGQTPPIVSRYVDNERWSVQECMTRARSALEGEGYSIRWTGGDIYRGDKAPYTAVIMCNATPDNLVRVNVIIAATSGDLEAENNRLWARLRNVATGGGCGPFEGVWTTNYTPITFRRSGSQVTGSYEYQGASTLSGTLSGNVLEGQYSQPNYPSPLYQRGRIRFVLSSDGQSFTGQWWDANGAGGGAWNGQCQTPAGPSTAGGVCADRRTQGLMDEWLKGAIPVENRTPGYNLRYEPWGRLVGTSPTANITAPNPPDTDLSRCEWLWRQAGKLGSTNLGTLREYIERRLG